jgi:hypothetical protein
MKKQIVLLVALIASVFGVHSLSAQVTTGLVGYWSFDDSTSRDVTGHGYNGTINGTPQIVKGIKGNAMHFSGSAEFVKIANKAGLNFGQHTTMSTSLWINIDKSDSDRTQVRTIFGKRIGGSDNSDYLVYTEHGRLYWGTGDASDGSAWMNVSEPSLGSWHHIATTIRYNPTSGYYFKKLYIDTKLITTDSGTVKADSVNEPLCIGYANKGGALTYFYGSVDEVRLYNRELTECDVEALYNFGNVLEGSVTTSTGAILQNSKLLLVKYNPADTSLTQVGSTTTDNSGHYCLTTHDSSVYLIAIPDSSNYSGEIPTYFDSSADFYGCNAILTSSSGNIANFHTLHGSNPGGSGFIGGRITLCPLCKTSGSGKPAVGVKIILSNNSDKIQAITYTDANGDFSFSNLSVETYKILVDRPTVSNKSAPAVVLTSSSSKQDKLNFTLYPTYLEANVTSGIEDNLNPNKFEIYPNPASTIINIRTTEGNKKQIVKIYNSFGQLIRLINTNAENTTINTSDLGLGIYILEVSNSNNSPARQQFIKK